jgi:hypothetical protein
MAGHGRRTHWHQSRKALLREPQRLEHLGDLGAARYQDLEPSLPCLPTCKMPDKREHLGELLTLRWADQINRQRRCGPVGQQDLDLATRQRIVKKPNGRITDAHALCRKIGADHAAMAYQANGLAPVHTDYHE